MEPRESNHEIMKRRMQKEFLKYDQEKMIQKFHLKADDDYLYLEMLQTPYRISRSTGLVEWSKTDFTEVHEGDYNETMTIYDLLCYAKEGCQASGEYTQIQNLSKVLTGSTYAGKGMIEQAAAIYDNRAEVLAKACRKIGGAAAGKGDVAYKIPVFQDLQIILRFWNSDEEFPASLQLFFDTHTIDYMHYETTWYLGLHLLRRLREAE